MLIKFNMEEFDVTTYKELNGDLQHLSDQAALIHYKTHGIIENRKYKYELPLDFDITVYRELNSDLEQLSDKELKIHYVMNGKDENRKYKYELPADFFPVIYRELNSDLEQLSDKELKIHYTLHGVVENRKYKLSEQTGLLCEEYDTDIILSVKDSLYVDYINTINNDNYVKYVNNRPNLIANEFKNINYTIICEGKLNNDNLCVINYDSNVNNIDDILNVVSTMNFSVIIVFNTKNDKYIINNEHTVIWSNNHFIEAVNHFIKNNDYMFENILFIDRLTPLNNYLLKNELTLSYGLSVLKNSTISFLIHNNDVIKTQKLMSLLSSTFLIKYNTYVDIIVKYDNIISNLFNIIFYDRHIFLLLNQTNIISNYNIKFNAIYFPQFHQIPENDRFWGEGFTEWTLLKPYPSTIELKSYNNLQLDIFKPLNDNYYDLNNVETLLNQIKDATKYNINGFIIYHYWFGNKNKLLYKPLEYFLNDDINYNFSISWANETWSRRWDGNNRDVLMYQDYNDEQEWFEHIHYLIPFFKKKNYMKNENNECLFYIYLIEDIEIKNSTGMFDIWHRECEKEGVKLKIIPTIGHNISNNNYVKNNFKEIFTFEPMHTISTLKPLLTSLDAKKIDINNFDIEFYLNNNTDIYECYKHDPSNLHKNAYSHFINYGIKEYRVYKYNNIVYNLEHKFLYKDLIDNIEVLEDKVYHMGFPLSWNNCVRRKNMNFVCIIDFEVGKIKRNLIHIISKLLINHKFNTNTHKYININAWNEWNEQAVLEPSNVHKYQILETFKNIMDNL